MSATARRPAEPIVTPEGPVPLKYLMAWLGLVCLTALTFAISYENLHEFQLLAAMAISTIKGALVIIIFMHLLEHPKMSRLALTVALLFLGLLTVTSITDVWTRFPPAVPSQAQWPENPEHGGR